jgi:pimeloyl-ACP methyl ester carboxylesterase
MTYSPYLGRWLEQDPIGFDAGDLNLYRVEGNNPTNEVDPSGLIGIIFDGSGYQANDGTIISRLIVPFAKGDTQASPSYYKIDLGNVWRKVNDAESEIEEILRKNPKEPIDIIGWSRGGMAALALAKKLSQHKPAIKVRFLGLIDPTAPVKKYTEDKRFRDLDSRNCEDNIENAALIVRDGKHDGSWAKHQVYRVFFQVKEVKFSKKTKVLVNKAVPLDHLQTGFSRDVGNMMWDAMKKAGIKLPPDEESPFMQKDYDEKPRGGRGVFGNMEKLIRELDLLPD